MNDITRHGAFIVFEGGEGSGKDTQIHHLKEKLPNDTVFTREPGGTPTAEAIRDVLLDEHYNGMSVKTELMLFAAARADHIKQVVAPALKNGQTVVCNRFDLSTFAYQIYGREHRDYLEFLQKVNDEAVGECVPDIYIYLALPVEEGLDRVGRRADDNTRFDNETLAFHARVHEGYQALAKERSNVVTVDGNQAVDGVAHDVWEVIEEVVEK